MFGNVFLYEIKSRLKSPTIWVCFIVLVGMSIRDISIGYWDDQIGAGRIARNSPFVLYFTILFAAGWSVLLGAGLNTAPLLADLRYRIAPVVYSTPVSDKAYFLGKYLASMVGLTIAISGLAVGIWLAPFVATTLGIQPASAFQSTPWVQLFQATVLFLLPGIYVYGTIHFCLAALTGRVTPSYLLVVLFVISSMMSEVAFGDESMGSVTLAAKLIEPFGLTALKAEMLFWSAEERASSILSWTGPLLWNRLLYIGIATVIFVWTFWRFDLRRLAQSSKSGRPKIKSAAPQPAIGGGRLRLPAPDMKSQWALRVAANSAWIDLATISREPIFRIIVGASFFFSVVAAWRFGTLFPSPDGKLLTVTTEAIAFVRSTFYLPLLLLVVFYSGEIIARARTARMHLIIDATPTPVWVRRLSNVISAVALALFSAAIPVGATIVAHFLGRHLAIDWETLAVAAFVNLAPALVALGLIGVFFQALINEKAPAHFLAIGTAVTWYLFDDLKIIEYRLALVGFPIKAEFSAFGSGGELLLQMLSYGGFWVGLGLFLVLLAIPMWAHGTETMFAARLARYRANVGVQGLAIAAALGGALVLLAAYVSSTVHTNGYMSLDERQRRAAQYEIRYGSQRTKAQPVIEAAELWIDLAPDDRRVQATGTFLVVNRQATPVTELILAPAQHMEVQSVKLDAAVLSATKSDSMLRHHVYALPKPIAPGGRAELTIKVAAHVTGFANSGYASTLVPDGAILDEQLFPRIGYQPDQELKLPGEREAFGLPGRVSVGQPEAPLRFAAVPYSARGTLRIHVTAPDDMVLAGPGKVSMGRGARTFEVDADDPANLFRFRIAAARYSVDRARWTGGPGARPVDIELYRHARHGEVIDDIVDRMRFALDRLTAVYGGYPHRTVRIVEVPNGLIEDTTTVGNMILVPEHRLWQHDLRRQPEFDWPQYLVARELARAWWGQRVAAAEGPGSRLIDEGLPAYEASRIVAARHARTDPQMMERRLEVLRNRYLRFASREARQEPSLLEWEDEPYLADKAIYALSKLESQIGTAAINEALHAVQLAQTGAPLPADRLFSAFQQPTRTDQDRELVEEALEKVVLYDNEVVSAVATRRAAKLYETEVQLRSGRLVVRNGDLIDSPAPRDVELAAFGRNGRQLVRTTLLLADRETPVVLRTTEAPVRVSLDPDRKLLDRNPADQVKPVRLGSGQP